VGVRDHAENFPHEVGKRRGLLQSELRCMVEQVQMPEDIVEGPALELRRQFPARVVYVAQEFVERIAFVAIVERLRQHQRSVAGWN
jgi:hypothetical protein